MKYNLSINNKSYEVSIEDINVRPVIAWVNGIRVEVAPENSDHAQVRQDATPIESKKSAIETSSVKQANSKEILAPLPGTVVEIFVKAGDAVETGQVVLVIEAMKMKNSIRSTRSGIVEEVLINAGQSVAHKQALIRFE